jgi:hypothetical protein
MAGAPDDTAPAAPAEKVVDDTQERPEGETTEHAGSTSQPKEPEAEGNTKDDSTEDKDGVKQPESEVNVGDDESKHLATTLISHLAHPTHEKTHRSQTSPSQLRTNGKRYGHHPTTPTISTTLAQPKQHG